MQTSIAEKFRNHPLTEDAEKILRKCVHCGFCLATCPTYNLLGDELDSPRGRIYLIKQVLEGEPPTAKTQLHLDRCLTCRNCETTCPSGVEYGHLVDAGKDIVDELVERPVKDRILRWLITSILPYHQRVGPLVKLGQAFSCVLPLTLRRGIPVKQSVARRPTRSRERKVIMLEGCVQPSMTPATNAATARVLDRLGIETINTQAAGCCGAVKFHLNDRDGAEQLIKHNIDAWWPAIEAGAEAIVVSASGCGVMIKDYGYVLRSDSAYHDKAKRVSELAKDTAELIANEDLSVLNLSATDSAIDKATDRATDRAAGTARVAYHPPCTLQHGQKLSGVTETILRKVGYTLVDVPDSHVCCGSAGTYSLLQRDLSVRLKANKVDNLESADPSVIATSNVGCQLHIQSGTNLPVKHWIELLDR